MASARVIGLWRYPVKSMAGEPLETAEVGMTGIPGDRAFALVDRRNGKVLSAKAEPRLLQAQARWADGEVSVALPHVGELSSDDPDVHDLLSGWLDREVRLERPVAGERATIENPDGDFRSPAGSFFDSRSTLHLLTEASLAAAGELYPAGDWDARRFRPNVLLSVDGSGFVEDGWTGHEVRLGQATARVRKQTGRCVLITRDQPGLQADKQLLRVLAVERADNLGVYADPVIPGRVTVGD